MTFNKKNRFFNNVIDIWVAADCPDKVSCDWKWDFNPCFFGNGSSDGDIEGILKGGSLFSNGSILLIECGTGICLIDSNLNLKVYSDIDIFNKGAHVICGENGIFLASLKADKATKIYKSTDGIEWNWMGDTDYQYNSKNQVASCNGTHVLVIGESQAYYKPINENTAEWTVIPNLYSNYLASHNGYFFSLVQVSRYDEFGNDIVYSSVKVLDGISAWKECGEIPLFGEYYNYPNGIKSVGGKLFAEVFVYNDRLLVALNDDGSFKAHTNVMIHEQGLILGGMIYCDNTSEYICIGTGGTLIGEVPQHYDYNMFISKDGTVFESSDLASRALHPTDKPYSDGLNGGAYIKNYGILTYIKDYPEIGDMVEGFAFLPYY